MTTPTAFEDLLKKTGFPEAGLAPIKQNVSEYLTMVTKSNGLVAQINAAKAVDPSKPGYADYLDEIWAIKAPADETMREIEAQYQALIEESEKLRTQLRDFAKNNIPEVLSQEESQKARQAVNEMSPTISESRKGIAAMLQMVESMLAMQKVELPQGGLITLLPVAESLKNVRGRKAATESGIKSNKTRVGEILIDGVSTNKDGKGKLDYAADYLSQKFNAQNIPANKVTAEVLEEEYFKSLGIEFRSLKSTELPAEHSFTFEKTILVQNKNDDSFTEVPQKVKVTVKKWENPTTATVTEKVEAKPEPVKETPAKKATEAPKK
jgi:hypothetical protein